MKNLWIFDKKELGLKKSLSILFLVMVFSGIFGFIYETIFYRIDLGYFVKRGSTFGPWIPIYAFGGVLITIGTYQFKKNPIIVFLLNCMITGILEYITGYVLFKYFGVRLWDYNTEIWNWGNINGFICARSILFFGISGLFLIYGIIPIIKRIVLKCQENAILVASGILELVFIIDMLVYWIQCHK
ncbi:MAG: putative ABC transporter permease [Clostridia bacterium]|nr:putative ABC transporter permease [Clostridia bacterium]